MPSGVESLSKSENLQELIDSFAERLQRSVALDDPSLSLIAASRHFGDEDTVRVQSVLGRGVAPDLQATVLSLGIADLDGPGRIAPPADLGAKPRICAPVRCAGVLLGYLWLIDDGLVGDDELRDTAIVADQAGMMLYRRELFLQRKQTRCSSLVRDLISADEPTRGAAELEALDEELVPPHAKVSVGVVRPAAPSEQSGDSAFLTVAQRATSMSTDPAVLCLPRPQELVVLVAHTHEDPDHPIAVTRRLSAAVADRLGVGTITGIGRQWAHLKDAHRAYQEALVAVRAARFLPAMGDLVTWDSLGVYALLAKLDPEEIAPGAESSPLGRLAASKNGDVLASTAETYLDLAGSIQRSAEALHVHRATLYQRLARIEAVTGLDLDDGGDRLTLHLALKLARLTGAGVPLASDGRQM
ncbi:PucR family transcriptional regulator [Nocardioides marmoriginsengisoli]|uniref:PucR family transcriptional regulator n=1 Tax=Nocardioides marmoriginsengisoli TaxID=661483 RepID=A0A3N0CFE3_9ACTN|nr:helix-turn-helix domain-containing protein [Nocardioides marmoriginsengisoli]RNL61951.1 PucR family transcriptional regulator [Nocardioides marmoriginsengisoli]